MGIDPKIVLVVGIKTEEHQRVSTPLGEDEIHVPLMKYRIPGTETCAFLEEGTLYDYLWHGPPMGSSLRNPGNIVGYIVDKISPYSWIARALMHIPECDNDHFVVEMPLREFSDNDTFEVEQDAGDVVSEHRNIINMGGSWGLFNSDQWWHWAIEILRIAGWEVKRTDLRLYLIMDWA